MISVFFSTGYDKKFYHPENSLAHNAVPPKSEKGPFGFERHFPVFPVSRPDLAS
jgi:hypothetical protein